MSPEWRTRLKVGIGVVIVLAAILTPLLMATYAPPAKLPGAETWLSNGAATMCMFDSNPTAAEVMKSMGDEGWGLITTTSPGTGVPPDSVRDWILQFKRGGDRLTIYGQAELTKGSQSKTGVVGVIYHDQPLPDIFYILRAKLAPPVSLNLSPQ